MDPRLAYIRMLLNSKRPDHGSKIIDAAQKVFDRIYERHAAALEALHQQRSRMHPQYAALRQQGQLLRQQHEVLRQQRSAALAQASDADQRDLVTDLYDQYETILDDVTEQQQETVTEFVEGFYTGYRGILQRFLDSSDSGLYDFIDRDDDVLGEVYESALDDLESHFNDVMDDFRHKLEARFGDDHADLFEELYDAYTDAFGELRAELDSTAIPDWDAEDTSDSDS